jgi:hypothetical protein
MPPGLGIVNVGEMLALPGFVSEKPKNVNRLSFSAQELFRNVASMLDELVVCAIEKRTAAEFIATFDEVFPKYFDGALGLSLLARTAVPSHVLEVLGIEFFCEMEADFRDQGLTAFGATVRDQAIFATWTLRKIGDICKRIDQAHLASSLEKHDMDLFSQFVFHAMRTRFHLDCLSRSMRLRMPIYPDVLGKIMDGLRSAVNAYAWARRALDLRAPVAELEIAPVEWDDEDRQLLREATDDDVLPEPA